MHDRREGEQKGGKAEERQYRNKAGREVGRTRGCQDRRDAGKESRMTRWMQNKGHTCRKDGMQDRNDPGPE